MPIKKEINTHAPLLKDIAYEKIKESILEEAYEPGSFLSERELIENLQMSKTPIKSALVRLETEGFVTVSSKQGIIVNPLSIERIIDIYNLRIAIESYVCEQITGKLLDSHIKKIEDNLDRTKQCVDNLDVKGFANLDRDFHLLLYEICGNQEIYKVLFNYQDHLIRITLKHLRKDPYRMKRFFEEHIQLTEQLKSGSLDCVITIKNHMQKSKEALLY
ncbi:GntR family transcriptional regulator [Anaerobacillus isosaccharinicus]|uniref:Transcriptional regulator n=1 Tax=Anaerobacillus isosaccharinicus TaxID=1532552 RepID=A0A1S2M6Y8_9BACI|nr:GntR family transcriptional regulator [Anaerobacillus isosaccharinicus]MBA5585018.1 GntR family transcriptional regulator [Anaerobacillus isosaccharinicus]QOY36630.1 GntR family transcriptional regulator [Anaerobacillus isosaccharinicus]